MSVAWQPRPYQLALPGLVKKSWDVVHNPFSKVLLEFSNLKSSSERARKKIPLISTPKSEALPSKSKVNIRNDQPTYSAIILEELC